MGNTRSLPSEDEQDDIWWNNNNNTNRRIEQETRSTDDPDAIEETNYRNRVKEELDEFNLELAKKHKKRREIMEAKQKEMQDLRKEVARLTQENEQLRKEKPVSQEQTTLEDIKTRNHQLQITIAELQKDLQELNGEVFNFEQEREDYKAHVVALKDVVSVSKQMLLIREAQLQELREKVAEIEKSLAGKEFSALTTDLSKEYEKQLQNIRNLRVFYEDRQRADRRERDELKRVLEGTRKELEDERLKNDELTESIQKLEEEKSNKYDEIKNLESNIGLTKAECRQYQSELAVINQLFSQILLGFNNTQEHNVDKLIELLEENHHILQDIAINEDSSQVSALPKVLLDLVSEMRRKETAKETTTEDVTTNPETDDNEPSLNLDNNASMTHQLNSATEIVENLPKVWRVLIELLSHQSAPLAISTADEKIEHPCYKLIETPKGPSLVLSVSQTFIRLKDLILEKKSLERETYRLKHLNTHLECRLQEQEKRLECVSTELTETWHVVGKLQKKHQLLHTQEKILRYELAQKRKLLTELKEELEYSREKWQEAREKNSNTEKQWEQLRIEFAARKSATCDDYSNSVESGYSDDKECSSEDDTDVSECAQKASVEEPTSEASSLPAKEDGISEVIHDEIAAITSDLAEDAATSDGEASGARGGEQRSFEEVLSAREQRLQRLEGQCSSLVKQVTNTSTRSNAISNKLDALHEIYGEGRSRNDPEASSTSEDVNPTNDSEDEEEAQ